MAATVTRFGQHTRLVVRVGFVAILALLLVRLGPAIIAADRAASGVPWFERASFGLVLIQVLAALRIRDLVVQRRALLLTVVGFALIAAGMLGPASETGLLVAATVALAAVEWPLRPGA